MKDMNEMNARDWTFTRALVVVALIAVATSAVVSAQLGGRPAEEWIKTLDGTARVSSLKIDEVVAAMKLKPGETVADIGAGSGLLSVPVAKLVGPKGKVYAVEIDAGFFPAIHKRAADNGVANIQTVLGEFTDPKLPARNVDVAFFHDVMHHIEDRAGYLKRLSPYLANSGRIVVIDYEAGKGPHPQDPTLQVSREQLTQWMRAAGFSQVAEAKLFEDKYVLTFARR